MPRSPITRGHRPDPWDDTGGHDVVTISRGEAVDIEASRVDGKVTIIDFGAPWCGPCHAAANILRAYLDDHEDVAVRAISLDGPDPKTSYAQPVARQHLRWVAGIPYFIVYSTSGRTIYKGADVDAVITAIDDERAR